MLPCEEYSLVLIDDFMPQLASKDVPNQALLAKPPLDL